jgi:hypothetical protein
MGWFRHKKTPKVTMSYAPGGPKVALVSTPGGLAPVDVAPYPYPVLTGE